MTVYCVAAEREHRPWRLFTSLITMRNVLCLHDSIHVFFVL